MSRFSYGAKSSQNTTKRMVFSLLFFVILFLFFVYATGALSSGNVERQKESLKNAISKNMVYHYATTGSYPATLEEIVNTYHLTYDSSLFYVDYRVRGRNIMPDVTIIEKGGR